MREFLLEILPVENTDKRTLAIHKIYHKGRVEMNYNGERLHREKYYNYGENKRIVKRHKLDTNRCIHKRLYYGKEITIEQYPHLLSRIHSYVYNDSRQFCVGYNLVFKLLNIELDIVNEHKIYWSDTTENINYLFDLLKNTLLEVIEKIIVPDKPLAKMSDILKECQNKFNERFMETTKNI